MRSNYISPFRYKKTPENLDFPGAFALLPSKNLRFSSVTGFALWRQMKKSSASCKHGRSFSYLTSHGSWPSRRLSLAELRSTTSCFETVLKFFDCRFSLIFRAFLPFQVSVVLFLNHKNRYFFNQKPSDVAHHLPPQKAPLVYCTSLLHRCP